MRRRIGTLYLLPLQYRPRVGLFSFFWQLLVLVFSSDAVDILLDTSSPGALQQTKEPYRLTLRSHQVSLFYNSTRLALALLP